MSFLLRRTVVIQRNDHEKRPLHIVVGRSSPYFRHQPKLSNMMLSGSTPML